MRLTLAFALLLGLLLPGAVSARADVDPSTLKCPVSGQDCDGEVSAAFGGGKVWFCCEKCLAAFEQDPAAFTAKARRQMVASEQLQQTGCPFSGNKPLPDVNLAVDGVSIGFCCPGCRARVAKAGPDEQLEMVFGKKSKGFASGE